MGPSERGQHPQGLRVLDGYKIDMAVCTATDLPIA
jgi:hypothetical protein